MESNNNNSYNKSMEFESLGFEIINPINAHLFNKMDYLIEDIKDF